MSLFFYRSNIVRCIFLCLVSGVASVLSYNPFNFKFLIIVTTAILFFYVRNSSIKKSVVIGFFYGLSMYGFGVSWLYISIHEFGNASIYLSIILVLLLVIFLDIFFIIPKFFLYAWINNRICFDKTWQKILLFTSIWVFWDWVSSWLFTGFPWLYTGYVLLDTPLQSLAPLVGVHGLSFLVIFIGSLVVPLFFVRREADKIVNLFSVFVVAVFLISIFYQNQSWTVKTNTLKFSSLQGNVSQMMKWNSKHINNTMALYKKLSESCWDSDLIFWPENAIPQFYSGVSVFLEDMGKKATEKSTAIITGVPIDIVSDEEDFKYYNGAIVMGNGQGVYLKQKMVPFGEFIPFEFMLRGLIDFFDMPMSSFSQGENRQPLLVALGHNISCYICYEIVYPDFVAKRAIGSDLLLTISNDTWFGNSIGPEQHFQMARMRALETGRYLVRSTNDGITAVINHKGMVENRIPRFQVGILTDTVQLRSGNTPFMVFGSWIVLGINGFIFIFLGLSAYCGKRAREKYIQSES